MYAQLQAHSYYSLHYGTISIDELVNAARAGGYRSLALTDIDNCYAVHAFVRACRGAGIRPIIGSEIRTDAGRAVALVRTREGFRNLTRLLTARKTRPGFDPVAALRAYAHDLIILSDSPGILAGLQGNIGDLYGLITPGSRTALAVAYRLGIPLAAAGDITLLDNQDFPVHRALRAIAGQTTIDRVLPEDCARQDACFLHPELMREQFHGYSEALANANLIADACTFTLPFEGYVFPEYRAGEGADVASLLRTRVIAGAERRYGELSESVLDRIEYELDIIGEKGFAPYFLVVADITGNASRICGRGSAAASIVSYCLGITNVDPIRHNLYFERFLNPARIDPPDIDVDFAWDERDAIIERTIRCHGAENTAMISTHVHFQWRSALREVARAYGMPDSEIAAVQSGFRAGTKARLARDGVWEEIFGISRRITGFPRHLGVHVGGLVITPGPVADYAPVEIAPKGVRIIGWDKDGAEDAGLVKIDLLGNRSLAVIRDAIAALRECGTIVDAPGWDPLRDAKTQQLLAAGDTIGVFYVESPAMRQLQKKTGRGDFGHLVIHSSIIRPAANRFIAEYVDRLRGKPYEPLDPRLEHILKESYGIMCYQEDVSKAAIALAGFTPAEGDGLRKTLTKKNQGEKLAAYKEKFFRGARHNGMGEGAIDRIWEMICSFDGYSFCKPHSASFAMVSFQSAYLKAHHPAAFMAAVLSNGGGYYTAAAYIGEARRLGIAILRPDVNHGRYAYVGGGRSIRVGFMAIANLRFETSSAIEREREAAGPFAGIGDFVGRMRPSAGDMEALIGAGALDSIAVNTGRRAQLWEAMRRIADQSAADDEAGLFPMPRPMRRDASIAVSEAETLAREFSCLGFLCDRHLFALWDRQISRLQRTRARDLARFQGKDITLAGIMVTRKGILTKDHDPMEFVSFEDEFAIFETVMFPEVYRRYGPVLAENRPFLIHGRVEHDRGALYLNIRALQAIVTG